MLTISFEKVQYYTYPTQITGVDANRRVVGSVDQSGTYGAFTESGGTFKNYYASMLSRAGIAGVTLSGTIFGSATDSNSATVGFTDVAGAITEIVPPGAQYTSVTAVSTASGLVAGDYQVNGTAFGFLEANGAYTKVDDPNSSGFTYLTGVNSALAVGNYDVNSRDSGSLVTTSHGFSYAAGSYQTIDPPNSINTYVNGISANGIIYGDFVSSADNLRHGFVDTNGVITLVDPAPNALVTVTGVSAYGMIVGYYQIGNGNPSGFVELKGAYRSFVSPYYAAGASVDGVNDVGIIYGEAAGASFLATVSVNTARDFNVDSHSDILFRRTSDGLAYLFTMNDATVTNGATLSTQVGNNWQIKGTGDFDGNGTSDLLFVYNNVSNASDPLNGISYITLQNGPAATSGSNVVQQLGPEWSVQGVGDFDGDGKADVLYRRSTDGALYLDAMNGASIDFSKSGFLSQQISDPHWQVAGIGDFNNDGKSDILWRYDNPSNSSDGLNGVVYEWTMNGTNVTGQGLISSQPGSNKWQVAGTGDFDGDGTTDILFRYNNTANTSDPLNGFTYLDFMNGTSVSSSSAPTQWQVDNSWSVASIGDYNGDGKSDILFQHAGDGATYIWDMNGTATTSGNFTSTQSGPGWAVQNGALIG